MPNDVGNVLRLWYLIEILSPQALRFHEPDKETGRDFPIREGDDLPWTKLSARQEALFKQLPVDDAIAADLVVQSSPAQSTPAFLVYLGISKIAHFNAALIAAAGAERTALDSERESKDSCAFATIQLNEEGVYIDRSLVISTLPWGLQQLRSLKVFGFVSRPKPQDFDNFSDRLRDTIPLTRTNALTAADFATAAEFVRAECALSDIIRFERVAHGTFYKLGSKEPLDLLNSFYYKDIIRAMEIRKPSNMPPILRHVFAEPDIESRMDLLHDINSLRRILDPRRFPAGDWPNTHIKPALMQQAALMLTGRLDTSVPILAVNGPPGTGKTTMIRSFVAGQVVERARRISRYQDVRDDWQFVPDEADPDSGYYQPPSHITGLEIVVASSNNGAVENISNELPDLASVTGYASALKEEASDYFSPVARNIAYGQDSKRSVWGLIAASLGNKSKRNAFIEPFLYNGTSRKRPPGHLTIREIHRARYKVSLSEACEHFDEKYTRFKKLRASLRPDAPFWEGDIKERHDQVPGLNEELRLLQHELFISALRVHRAYIGDNWRQIEDNLHLWAKVARRPELYSADKALALWQTLFLVVPVVSTTFASASRMFGNVEDLGWVVVDEAGQAVPQAALGLFMKARRALVIGDPLQLEPIITLSSSVIMVFRKLLDIDSGWVASNDTRTSLQTIVDRVSPWGCNRKTKSGSFHWVGVPLIVHRRCLEPMFSVANDTVYGGDMLFRTSPEPHLSLYPFGESAWIDERSARTGRHAVGAQIKLALNIVNQTRAHYAAERDRIIREGQGRLSEQEMKELQSIFVEPDIRVITPFREIESHFDLIARKAFGDSGSWSRWCRDYVGTVHKAQGKEAGLVICVLGLDPSSSGAADFATEKPNFLNVTITRSKHRLYVIGNAALWGKKDYFRDLLDAFIKRSGLLSVDMFLSRYVSSLPNSNDQTGQVVI